MQVVGRLIYKQLDLTRDQNAEFYRIVILEELGHRAEHKKLSVFDEEVIKQLALLEVGTHVKLDTHSNYKGYQSVSKIEVIDEIVSCHLCYMFSNNEVTDGQQPFCDGCQHDVKQERISGVWLVKATREYVSPNQKDKMELSEIPKKLLLQQETNLLGFVTFPKSPFFDLLSGIKMNDAIELTGWRDDYRRFTIVSASHKMSNVKQVEAEECCKCEFCGKVLKNKNSLRTHRSLFHKKC